MHQLSVIDTGSISIDKCHALLSVGVRLSMACNVCIPYDVHRIIDVILWPWIYFAISALPIIWVKIVDKTGPAGTHEEGQIDKALRFVEEWIDRKSTRLNSSHIPLSRMPSSA